MTSVSDWSVAFCLACDNQTHDGPYCSQSCRVADLERSHSHPTASRSHSTSSVPSSNNSPAQTNGLYMPPSVNFSAYQSPGATPYSPSSSTRAPGYQRSFSTVSSVSSNYVLDYSDPEQARRLSLAESEADMSSSYFSARDYSSRPSASSFYSYYATPSVSETTRQQLSSYESSFDKVRHRKYRH